MQDQDKLNQAYAQALAEAAANAGDKLHDLEPPGKLLRRPLKMGMLRMCEGIGLEIGDNPTMADLGILFFMLAGPLEMPEMWALVAKSPQDFRATAWAFSDELSPQQMAAINAEMNASRLPAGGGDGPTAKS